MSYGDSALLKAVEAPQPRLALKRAVGRASLITYTNGRRIRDKGFSVLVSGALARAGRRMGLQLPLGLSGADQIAIGSDVFLGAGSRLEVLEGADPIAIQLGDGTSVAGHCVFSAAKSIAIGRQVSFARNVSVYDHRQVPMGAQKSDERVPAVAPIEIGDGAWLGENVVVLPGARIGRGAVISANSVVSREIPDHCLAAGVPARVIRRFGDTRRSTASS